MDTEASWQDAMTPQPKPFYEQGWFIALVLIAVLCVGLPIAAIAALGFAGLKIYEEEVEAALEMDPIVHEHIGEDVTEIEFLFLQSEEHDDEDIFVYSIRGEHGSGKATVDTGELDAGRRLTGTLELSTGESFALGEY